MSNTNAATTPALSLQLEWTRITVLLESFPLDLLLLIGRVSVASVFFKSGLTKIASWEVAVQLFQQEYMVPVLPPDVAAMLAATFELGASSLLMAGIFTRLATLPLIGMILVIEVFVYPDAWVDHLMWFTVLLLVLTRGPGVFSLDAVFGRLFGWSRK
ncbi:MAG: DoxX family protein [Micropepsaceae bacterium]